MSKLSQNKKIAISAVSLFAASFSTMLFFLGGGTLNPDDLKASVTEGETRQEETTVAKDEAGAGGEARGENLKEDTIFVTDVEGFIQKANPGFCRLVGQDCKELVGQKFFDLVNKDDLSELASIYGKLGLEGKRMDAIGPIRLIDGQNNKLVMLSAFPVVDKEGKVIKIRFSAKDITKKVEDLKLDKESEENLDKDWMRKIYPKIKELNEQGNKLLVKISYSNQEN